ncbi:MAG: hypothetical protein COU40_01685 [Candidatus Moranbacteria bacterium CG10_big_fil_rev_8_21_14_0_10_35_21]|nr:MAG: hypothetical protein COU40_01685 [Candidatus Moranbacteria bacterium CG10_big_fil_rev_8_21_14_0_10_35_21]PJA88743.1 MAG: hypothetical protein CO139_01460 [Candidatus Moranbacteria bacterium CG_4_9_14_3_um_filter_36_9]
MQLQNIDPNQSNQPGEEKKDSRKINDIQREIVMQESDLHKKLEEKTRLEAEVRALKKETARIKIQMQEKQIALDKLSYELVQFEAEIKKLKKEMNLIK